MIQEENYVQEIENSLNILRQGKTLLYPTDTIWGIGCDVFCEEALRKVYQIKARDLSKPMILLVDSIERLSDLVEVPKKALEMIRSYKTPLTIIYEKVKKNIPIALAGTTSLAIRLVNHPFSRELIERLNSPIVSTSANFSGSPTPCCFDEIDPLLLQQVDYVVNLSQKETHRSRSSSIIRVSLEGGLQIVRK